MGGGNYDAAAEALELRHNPRFFTAEQLKYHDGADPSRCLLLAIKGSKSVSVPAPLRSIS